MTIQKPLILVVDDIEDNLVLMTNLLQEQGYEVMAKFSGSAALRVVEKRMPDLILLDVIMPGINGFEICRTLKKSEQTRDIPVIFLTSLSETSSKVEGFEAGGVDFITKPFEEAEVLARVSTHLHLVRLQREHTEHIRKLEELNREKNEFLSIAAHDLKNPLTVILLTTGVIRRHSDKFSIEEMSSHLQKIETTTRQIQAIITNMLSINAIETGRLVLSPSTIDVAALVRETVKEYQERAALKNITLHIESTEEYYPAYADVEAMQQILDNLISNSVKYSPHDRSVSIRILKHSAEKNLGTGSLWLEVEDEGPGFSEQDKHYLFEKFARLSAKATGGEQSTGLGLSIVKKLTEAMNGRVWCESEAGKGAKFIVELPAG